MMMHWCGTTKFSTKFGGRAQLSLVAVWAALACLIFVWSIPGRPRPGIEIHTLADCDR
jgi:hypothetical protein